MNPLEVINPLEVRVWLFYRLEQAPRKSQVKADADDDDPILVSVSNKDASRKEQKAGPIALETSPSSQPDPESPLYGKYRKGRQPHPLCESKSSVQNTCGKENHDANNGDEILLATDSRRGDGEEVAGKADICDRDLTSASI